MPGMRADRSPFADLHDEMLMRGFGRTVAAGVPIMSVDDVGALVRRQRGKLDLTQCQLAEKARVGRRFVSELEAGKATIRAAELLAVCAAADLTLTIRPGS